MSALAIQVKDLQTALKVEQDKAAEQIGAYESQVKELTDAKTALETQVQSITKELESVKASLTETEAKAKESEEAKTALEAEKAEAETALEQAKAQLADPSFKAAKPSDGKGQSVEDSTNPTMSAAEYKALDPRAQNEFYRNGGKIV
jgi:septal ring factor EnvC (AmiA/AmiB activator)